MLVLKYQLPIPRPRPVDGTLLPAACAIALVGTLGIQLAIPRAAPLPEAEVVHPFKIDAAQLVGIVADPVIETRPIFQVGVGGNAALRPQGPVDGSIAIGVISRQGVRTAFVQDASGAVSSLALGDHYHGWQLRTMDRDRLTFDRNNQSESLPITVQGAARSATLPSPSGNVVSAPSSPLVQTHG